MSAPREVQDERNAEWWEPKPFEFTMPDEPEELTRLAEAVKTEREYQDARCADCGERRAAHFGSAGHIVGIDHGFVEVCPNADDPVLCKVHDGMLVPEAGCPVHDAEDGS